jgi:hypothetical protein
MIPRVFVATALCAGSLAGPPAPGPGSGVQGLAVPCFRLQEASRRLAAEARNQREVPGAVVEVVAVDERERAGVISTAIKQQFEPQAYYLNHRVGHLRLYALMAKPGAVDTSGLGLHNYGCFYPSSAVPP